MIIIKKKKINMSDELKAKINWSCKFSNRPYQIIEGCLRIVEHTNLAYVEPHKVIKEYYETKIYELYETTDEETGNIIGEFTPKRNEKIIRILPITPQIKYSIKKRRYRNKI